MPEPINPKRSDLGSLVLAIPRPLKTMRGWMLALGILLAVFVLWPPFSVVQLVGGLAASLTLLYAIRRLGAVRIYELGLESGRVRFRWEKIAAYRLSWGFGPQVVLLIEQATRRELPVFLAVYESEDFRAAVGSRINLGALVKIGVP